MLKHQWGADCSAVQNWLQRCGYMINKQNIVICSLFIRTYVANLRTVFVQHIACSLFTQTQCIGPYMLLLFFFAFLIAENFSSLDRGLHKAAGSCSCLILSSACASTQSAILFYQFCLSVRLSCAGIVSKRLYRLMSDFCHRLMWPSL